MKTNPNYEILHILRNTSIFAGLPDKNLLSISSKCKRILFHPNDVIIRENAPGKDIMVVLCGLVKVVLGIDGNPTEIIRFGPGNCIGEVSVIGILNHSASVIAVKETEMLVITKQLLMDIFNEDKELFSIMILNIARELARRLHFTDSIILHYSKLNHDVREDSQEGH